MWTIKLDYKLRHIEALLSATVEESCGEVEFTDIRLNGVKLSSLDRIYDCYLDRIEDTLYEDYFKEKQMLQEAYEAGEW